MKILLVVDQFFSANNGMTISARRFAETLQKHGNEVRIVSTGKEGDTEYLMKKQYIPFFDKLVSSQGMTFAKPNKKILKAAVEWADVVHLLTPFVLSHTAVKILQKSGVPYTAAFHVQPENITASIHLANVDFINSAIYKWFRFFLYNKCGHIHCPSQFIAGELKKNGYSAKIHVISNGIDPDFAYRKLPKPAALKDKFVILMTGRLSREKRQDVLIDAVKRSRHADKIQLILAGQGPRAEALRKQAADLKNPIIIQFFSKNDLLNTLAFCDLYVHAADMEIEAMSCMEAFACGLVPVIADSPKSATPQFALDQRSLFPAGNSRALAERIDYWLEHEDERIRMGKRYSEHAKNYRLDDCVSAVEAMFRESIEENQTHGTAG